MLEFYVLIFIVIFSLIIGLVWRKINKYDKNIEEALATKKEVVRRSDMGDNSYYVMLETEIKGQRYIKEFNYIRLFFAKKIKGKIKVYYNPENPQNFSLSTNYNNIIFIVVILLLLLLAPIIPILMYIK